MARSTHRFRRRKRMRRRRRPRRRSRADRMSLSHAAYPNQFFYRQSPRRSWRDWVWEEGARTAKAVGSRAARNMAYTAAGALMSQLPFDHYDVLDLFAGQPFPPQF
jgi:hypothetical protein